jgi:hypothetical protein
VSHSHCCKPKHIQVVRAPLRTFGAGYGFKTSIDLIAFATALEASATGELKVAAKSAADAAKAMIDVNYASDSMHMKATRAQGIAIYFPATKADYLSDTYRSGYRKANTDHPVAFVADTKWPDFIAQWVH